MSKTILLSDDDQKRRALSAFGLRCAGFAVEESDGIDAARAMLGQRCPDLILIVSCTIESAIHEFVQTLRADQRTNDVPVMLGVERETDFGAERAHAWGLEDYIVEPVSPDRLIARVRVALDRRARAARDVEKTLGVEWDAERGTVRKGTRSVALRPTEQRLLAYFLEHPDQLITREMLLFRVWGSARPLPGRVIDINVCRLRGALKRIGCERLLQTVSGAGYRFVPRRARASRSQANPRGSRHDGPESHANAVTTQSITGDHR